LPLPVSACVGRTITVGYYDIPEQVVTANILAVFIDERTGTTVNLQKFATREEVFEALRKDRVSIYADHVAVLLALFAGERPSADDERNFSRLNEILSRKHNVAWLSPLGYDRPFSGAHKGIEKPGPAGLVACRDALAKFPALPKLLAKLRGAVDNETMARLLREVKDSDPRAVARRFLKSRKLI
jgi:glycine betaine/choline ABC-type transport system substrate-binding protein